MEPVFGFALFAIVTLAVSVIASKRGRSGILVFVFSVAIGVALVILTSNAGGGSVGAGFAAFVGPLGCLFWVMSSKKSEAIAVEEGSHGDFKKCRFCAESVRKEAIKCKHCGSDLSDPIPT